MVNILVQKKKEKYGPIMNALLDTGAKACDQRDAPLTGDTICFENKPDFIAKAKIREGKLAWWMCDLRNPHGLGKLPRPVDAIFLCNKQYLNEYKEKYKIPVYYLPQCGLSGEMKEGREIKWDIVFIGSILSGEHHSNRWPIIEALKTKHNVKLIFNEGSTEDQQWIYNQTPISLAISPQVWGYTSNRLYNILASKGFCLTLWFPGIEDLFENHKHLVWFKDEQEALELVEYYLKNKDKRMKIAEAGYRLYQENHTAQHRINSIINKLYAV